MAMETRRVNKVIVIGEASTAQTRAVSHAIESQGLTVQICSTPYAAAAVLGKVGTQLALLVGPTQVLARENGFLVRLAEQMGVACCCLCEWSAPLPEVFLRAMANGTVVMCPAQKFGLWFKAYLGQFNTGVPQHQDKISEPLVSAAEQAALLGGWDDV